LVFTNQVSLVSVQINDSLENIKKNLFLTGHLEGVSFLLLLFVAMPLKYILNLPVAVQIIGSLHGILFVAFMVILFIAWRKLPLTFMQAAKVFLLSFVPFGTFFLHKIVKQDAIPVTV